MKKILLAIYSLLFVSTVFATNSTAPMSSNEGKLWHVVITVNVTYDYYETSNGAGYITSVSGEPIEQTVDVYAETADAAETKAKQQCSYMCSTSGVYQGTRTYGGKTVHVFKKRTIESARAN